MSSFFILLHCCFKDVLKRTRVQYFFGGNSLLHSSPRPIGSVMEPAAAVGECVCLPGCGQRAENPDSLHHHIWPTYTGAPARARLIIRDLFKSGVRSFLYLLPRGRENGRWMVGGAIGAQLVREEGSARFCWVFLSDDTSRKIRCPTHFSKGREAFLQIEKLPKLSRYAEAVWNRKP